MIWLKQLELPTVVQSPMANCTDLPFRLIARSHGMGFAFLEMISSEALVRDVQRTHEMMQTLPEDRPLGAQLVGCDPAVMGEAAARIEAMGYDLVDLNLGCPVPKIVSKGGGSMLLREPDTAGEIFTRVVRAVRRIPVTVKMRLGFSDGSGEEAAKIARIAQGCGVDAIAVHGRTREQGYTGPARYDGIRRVKEAVSIPVIGNGDVVDGASAKRLQAVSGCDGVMLGRGALGNPWIYRQVQAALNQEAPPPFPDLAERKRVLLRHVELQQQYEEQPLGHLRRIICWYFKDCPGVAEFRNRVHQAQSVCEMRDLIEAFPSCSL
ncbi:MAG: tRNA dihydrouridine synthase DusB [Candidatus Omnitrophica bacterium]|nr:tRNA dihydrouridine synthase DusB [Candidatus Omnitrophota bacterium]MBI3084114.1 tRNA dihydrouridine synthase DusB [Candidatus Omnitrophota bacterium]